MSTVSKILVVLILVLVAGSCFIQVSLFAQRANYRALFNAEKENSVKGIAALETKITEKDKEISELNQSIQSYKANANNLTSKVTDLENELAEEKEKVLRAESLARDKETDLAAMTDKIKSLTAELQAVHEKARRDSQDKLDLKREFERLANQVTALRDKANSLMMSLTNTRSQLEQALAENEELTHTLRKYSAADNKEIEVIKPKQTILAHVLAANDETGVVFLSVGKDDKVELGMEFIIHRGESYICKVRVETVYPDNCIARVISETINGDKADIEVGDNAFTD